MSYWRVELFAHGAWHIVGGGSSTRDEAVAYASEVRKNHPGCKFRIRYITTRV